MTAFFAYRFVRVGLIAALVCGFVVASGKASAANTPSGNDSSSGVQQDSVKIEPYKGPPIFLDAPEQVVAEPKLVSTQTLPEKLGDGKVEREVSRYSDNSFAANGFYREYYPNGKLFIDGQFQKGRQEGEWKYYYDNGQINRKLTFKNGKPNGSWEVFRADGTLAAKRGFSDGLRDGEWIRYDDTGKKKLAEEHYVAGNGDGVSKAWFPSGQLKVEANFKNGKRHGKSTEWDEKGQKLIEADYADGKFNGTVTRWYADGKKLVLQYENGKLKSESKQ